MSGTIPLEIESVDAPPPKPKPKPKVAEGLDEVERALSVLQGRHPEHERLRREDEERRASRKAEHDAKRSAEGRKRTLRRLVLGGSLVAGLALFLVAGLAFRSEVHRRGRLEQAADPYRAAGFDVVEVSSRGDANNVTAAVGPGCLVAVSTDGSRPRLTFAGSGGGPAIAPVEGASPLVTCICDGAQATLSGSVAPGEGLVLLRADAALLGGSRAFAFLPFAPGAVAVSDATCAEASLDSWLDARRWADGGLPARAGAPRPSGPIDSASESWFGGAARAPLREAGFKVIASLASQAPLAVVEVPAASCLVVAGAGESDDKVSLRLKGGAIALGPAAGDLAWCSSHEATVVVQRASESARARGEAVRTIVSGPAVATGGLGGLREVAAKTGVELRDAETAIPSADHAWNGKALLVASQIPESLVTVASAPDFGTDTEARIVALSVDKPGTVVSDAADGVYSYCDPPLESSALSVCVFSGPQRWAVRGSGDNAAGLARAKLPFWLFALQGVSDPPALKLEAELVRFARRLARRGFEATAIEAVTETDKGAEVLGRANEDTFIALGLAPTEPWVFPYGEAANAGGQAWTLEGEPRVIPIKPLERIQVGVSGKTKLPAKATRRTVVFRHQKR